MSGVPCWRSPVRKDVSDIGPRYYIDSPHICDKLTMPMDGIFHGQVVRHKHFKLIALVDLDEWTGLLPVDEIDWPGNSIYAGSLALDRTNLVEAMYKEVTWSVCPTMDREIILAKNRIG